MRAKPYLLVGVLLAGFGADPNPAWALPDHPTYDIVLGQLRKGLRRLNFTDEQGVSSPLELAINLSHTPTHLYLAEQGNGRILGWRDVRQFRTGAAPDLVIGQPDKFVSEWYRKDNRSLAGVIGVAVDKDGTVWASDLSNGRVLGWRWPFDPAKSADENATADFVIGQPDFGIGFLDKGCNGGYVFGGVQGYATDSVMCNPAGLTTNPSGNLYVTDSTNSRVLMFQAPIADKGARASIIFGQDAPKACTTSADCTTAAPTCTASFCRYSVPNNACNKGPGRTVDAASLCRPQGAFTHQDGSVLRLYVADAGNNRVVVYDDPLRSQTAARVFGQPVLTTSDKGLGPDRLNNPTGVSVDLQGVVWVGDATNNRLLGFVPPFASSASPGAAFVIGQIDCNAGQPNQGQAGKPVPAPTASTLFSPRRPTFDPDGRMLVPDTADHRVLAFSGYTATAPAATAVYGQPDFTHASENYVQSQGLAYPVGVTVDRPDPVTRPGEPLHVYVADFYNSRVLGWWDLGGLMDGKPADLVIGQRTMLDGTCNTGRGVSARTLCWPRGVSVDKSGDLWVADTWNHRVLRFPRPFGGPRFPEANLVLGQNDLLSSQQNQNGGKVPSAASLWHPSSVVVAADGTVWVADRDNDRVLGYLLPYKNGMDAARLLIGTGITSFGVVGCTGRPATGAAFANGNYLCGPTSLALDAAANLWVVERDNNRVALYRSTPPAGSSVLSSTALAILGQPNQLTVVANGATPAATSLRAPEGVAVEIERQMDGSFRTAAIVVADSGNSRVLAYAPTTTAFQPAATTVYGQEGAFTTRLNNYDAINTELQASVQKGLWAPAAVAALPEALLISDSGTSSTHSTRTGLVQPGASGTGNNRLLVIKGPTFPAPSATPWQPPDGGALDDPDMLPPAEPGDMAPPAAPDLSGAAPPDLRGPDMPPPGGCSCQVGGGAEPVLPLLGALLLGVFLRRRRRS